MISKIFLYARSNGNRNAFCTQNVIWDTEDVDVTILQKRNYNVTRNIDLLHEWHNVL